MKRPFECTWGLSQEEWDACRERMTDVLRGVAASRATITYGEIADIVFGGRFSARSTALMQMLEEVCRTQDAKRGIMLASIVVRKDTGIPGDGYFVVADDLGREVRIGDPAERRRMWEREVTRVWDVMQAEEGYDS